MSFGMEVGLGPGHIVLDWDPAALSPKGAQSPRPNVGPACIVAERSPVSATDALLFSDGNTRMGFFVD